MPYIALKLATAEPLSVTHIQQLVEGITNVMVNTLHKKRHLVAVSLDYLPTEQWFIASQALYAPNAFMHAYITEHTNTEAEKAQAIAELSSLLATVLGIVAEATYIFLSNVPASDWGYAGKTQASRYLAPAPLSAAQYQMYVQRAHALQKAQINAYFSKLLNLSKLVFSYCLVLPFNKVKTVLANRRTNLPSQLKSDSLH